MNSYALKMSTQNVDQTVTKSTIGGIRFIIVGLLFCMLVILFGIRVSLSLAIIAMTTEGISSNPDVPFYAWDNSSIILSSFYWSYAILQFFAGHLVLYFGCKKLLFSSVFVSSLANILVPWSVAYGGSYGVITLRVLQGLFQGFMLPCLNGLLGRWLPPNELSFMNSIVHAGAFFGQILCNILIGYLSESSWGWPGYFYLSGVVGLVWCLGWVVLSADCPASHPYICLEERKYIEQALGQEADHMVKVLVGKPAIPWSEIFRSKPYWAIMVASIGESWLSTYSSTQLPSYLSYAVGLDIVKNGMVSAASTGVTVISSLIIGGIASFTLKMGWMSVVNSRRLFQALSQYSFIIVLLTLSFIETPEIVIGLFIASNLGTGGMFSGHLVNSVDLSPRFASSLSGMANGTGQIIAILAPLLVQYMVTDKTNRDQWRNTFYLASAVGGVAVTFFIVFCSGERQWWDDIGKNEKKDDEESNQDNNAVAQV